MQARGVGRAASENSDSLRIGLGRWAGVRAGWKPVDLNLEQPHLPRAAPAQLGSWLHPGLSSLLPGRALALTHSRGSRSYSVGWQPSSVAVGGRGPWAPASVSFFGGRRKPIPALTLTLGQAPSSGWKDSLMPVLEVTPCAPQQCRGGEPPPRRRGVRGRGRHGGTKHLGPGVCPDNGRVTTN